MDASEDDLRRNFDALQHNSTALHKLADLFGGKRNSTGGKGGLGSTGPDAKFDWAAATSAINQHSKNLGQSFKTLGGSAESLIHGFDNLLRNFIGGAVVGELLAAGHKLSDSYKKLTDIGQTFGGSMFEMARQAGEAGLPLGEFSRMLGKNSTASAVLAQQSGATGATMGTLGKAVRDGARDFGFYGMSLGAMNDLTSDYTETLRLQGRAAGITKEQTAKEINSFAKDISDFAQVTGKSRAQIAKATMDAMHDVGYAARDFTVAQQESGRKAIAFMASLPGTAGDMMAKMLSQTIAYGGAVFADDMHTFAEAGQAGFLSIMDTIGQKANQGRFSDQDATESLSSIQKYFANNKASLLAQSKAGNQQARQVLGWFEQMNSLSAKEYGEKMRAADQFKSFTLFFSKIEDALSTLAGNFLEGMMKPLKKLDDAGTKFPDLIKLFSGQFAQAGEAIGNIIAKLAKPESLTAIADVFQTIMRIGNVLLDIGGVLTTVIEGAIAVFTAVSSTLKTMFGDKAGGLLTGLLGIALLFHKKIASIFRLFVPKITTINTGSVILNAGSAAGGGHGGAGGLGGTPGGPGGPAAPGGRRTLRERFKAGLTRGKGGLAAAAAGAVGMLGGGGVGDGCCEGLTNGLKTLTDRVDFHGDRAHGTLSETAKASAAQTKAAQTTAKVAVESESGVSGGTAKGRFGRALDRSHGFLKNAAGRTGGFLAEHAGTMLGRGAKLGMTIGKGLLKGIPGVVGALAGVAIDKLVPDGTRGKETAQTALEWGGIGATLGSFIPGVGTIVGGAVGALAGVVAANFDDIKKHLPGGGSGATPATPNDADNPLMTRSVEGLSADYQEVTEHLAALQQAAADQPATVAEIRAGNIVQQEILRLQTEQAQIEAVRDRRHLTLQQRQVASTDTLVGAGS